MLNYLLDTILNYLNQKAKNDPLPEELKNIFSKDDFEKSRAYQKDNYSLGLLSSFISIVSTLAFFFFGGFEWLDQTVRNYSNNEIIISLLFVGVLGFASSILSLPFSIYKTFVIEEKYGFNKNTPLNFILDLVKGAILATVLGGSIFCLILWIYQILGDNFWWVTWITISILSLLMTLFFSNFIVPLFNKQTPLEDGALKDAIDTMASKLNFNLENIFVIDGSKRSTKANAYFSGLGSKKRIVLYDTLIDQLSEEEVVAVLAHEIGHYKKKHTLWGMLMSISQTGLLLFIFSLFVGGDKLSEALGVSVTSFHIGIIAFAIFWSPISTFSSILSSFFSRKFEYQADDYAKAHFDGEHLITSLKKLTANSFGNLTPHPWFVFFHYSHPTLLQRIRNLRS